MALIDQNLLFFTRTMALGGTENVILQLCEIMKPLVRKIVVCSSGGVNEKKLEEMGILHYRIPDIEKKDPGTIRDVRKTLKKIIHDDQISIIHTHHRMAAFYCQLVKLPEHILLINTSHTAFYDKRFLTHLAFRNFHMIACGDGVKKSLVQGLGFNERRVKVICNGVKLSFEEVRSVEEIVQAKSKGYMVAGMIGRLSKEKGTSYLLEAIDNMSFQEIVFLIVGTGPDEHALKGKAEEMKCSDRIVFLGYRQDVHNLLKQMDFIVQPSLQEGLPLVLIEAMSEGKTAVATDIEGNAEVVRDHVNGLLVPPADGKHMAKALDEMCRSDRTLYENNAKETYQKRFSFEAFREQYVEFYEKLISSGEKQRY